MVGIIVAATLTMPAQIQIWSHACTGDGVLSTLHSIVLLWWGASLALNTAFYILAGGGVVSSSLGVGASLPGTIIGRPTPGREPGTGLPGALRCMQAHILYLHGPSAATVSASWCGLQLPCQLLPNSINPALRVVHVSCVALQYPHHVIYHLRAGAGAAPLSLPPAEQAYVGVIRRANAATASGAAGYDLVKDFR